MPAPVGPTGSAPVRPANNGTTPANSGTPSTPTPAPVDPDQFDGQTVRKAEQLLKKLGYSPGRVDTTYTANTQAALEKFQTAAGLTANGIIDSRAMNAMRKAARDKDKGVQSQGQHSASIKKQEQRLRRLGYDTGTVDGTFDKDTVKAVRAFKKDQKMEVNDALGKRGREILENENKALNHAPRRIRVKKSERRARLDRRVTTAAKREHADGTKGFGVGSRGTSIKVVQNHLKAAGFDPKHNNGVFDERTAGMVKQFQARSGIPVSGRVDERTWNKLKQTTIESTGPADPPQKIGEKSGAVKNTEKMLKKLGHNVGKVDGLYTEQTERAVDSFRRKHHMGNHEGVGPNTLRAIRKAYKKKTQPNTNTVKGAAQFLLNHPNVSFWTGLSTGSDEANMRRIARTGKGFVNATGQHVTPKLSMMKALVAMAKAGPIQITALTGGIHSTNSNHYRGTAVDISIHTGSPSEIERIANRFGGFRNFERDHIHLDF